MPPPVDLPPATFEEAVDVLEAAAAQSGVPFALPPHERNVAGVPLRTRAADALRTISLTIGADAVLDHLFGRFAQLALAARNLAGEQHDAKLGKEEQEIENTTEGWPTATALGMKVSRCLWQRQRHCAEPSPLPLPLMIFSGSEAEEVTPAASPTSLARDAAATRVPWSSRISARRAAAWRAHAP